MEQDENKLQDDPLLSLAKAASRTSAYAHAVWMDRVADPDLLKENPDRVCDPDRLNGIVADMEAAIARWREQ